MSTRTKTLALITLVVLGGSVVLPLPVSAQESSLDANQAIVRQFVDEVWNQGNFEHIDALVSPDSTVHHYLLGTLSGTENVLGWIGYARSLVPDLHVTIEHLIAQGEEVVMHWTSRGTFAGVAGWPANQYSGSGLIVYRLQDGLIAEQWYSADSLQEAQNSSASEQTAAPDPARTGEEAANLQSAIDLVEAMWNDHDLSTFDQSFALTFVNTDPSFPNVRYRDDFRQWVTDMLAAFPDLHTLVDGASVDGDTVVLRLTSRGTHSGNLAGLPVPTGALLVWTGTVIMQLNAGQVQAMWWSRDAWSVQQTGPVQGRETLASAAGEDSQAFVSQALDWLNTHDLSALDDHFAPVVAIHSASAAPRTVDYYGLDGARAFFAQQLGAFPDATFIADDIIAEGDFVVVRWTMHGTFSGEYMGRAGGGQTVEVSGIDLWRVSNDQVVELWRSMDTLSMLQQMGIIAAAS